MTMIYIVLGLMIALAPMGLSARDDRRSIRQGNQHFKENNFQEAEILYRRAVGQNPQNYRGNFNLGSTLYRQNRHKEAADAFGRVLALDISDNQKAGVLHNLGNSLLKSGNYAESAEAYKKALRLNPDDNETRFNLAYAMLRLQNQKQPEQQNHQSGQSQQNQQNRDRASLPLPDTQQQQGMTSGRLTLQEVDKILDALNKREQALLKEVQNQMPRTQSAIQERDW